MSNNIKINWRTLKYRATNIFENNSRAILLDETIDCTRKIIIKL
jgi:hypothetical protein